MRSYTILHIPLMCFYSKALYREVATEWRGTGLAYIFLLLLVCWIPITIALHHAVGRFVENEAPKIVSQIPTFSIVDGQASIQEPQPYAIREPDTGRTLIIIDTTGQTQTISEPGLMGLITKTEAIVRKSEIETRTFSFAQIKEFTLDRARINEWLGAVREHLAVTVYPFAVVGSFVGRAIQMMIYATLGVFFVSLCKGSLSFTALCRLTAVAQTPVILIKTVLLAAGIVIPGAGLLYFLGAMAYLFYGIRVAVRPVG